MEPQGQPWGCPLFHLETVSLPIPHGFFPLESFHLWLPRDTQQKIPQTRRLSKFLESSGKGWRLFQNLPESSSTLSGHLQSSLPDALSQNCLRSPFLSTRFHRPPPLPPQSPTPRSSMVTPASPEGHPQDVQISLGETCFQRDMIVRFKEGGRGGGGGICFGP